MAHARVFEIKRCAGVDEAAAPAGMVVPFGGVNQFALETSGMETKVASKPCGEEGTRVLMMRGGSSWAIPFGMVKRARAFSGKPA